MPEPKDPFHVSEDSPEVLKEKMKNPEFLPTHDQIFQAFKMEGYNRFDTSEWMDFLNGPYKHSYEIINQEFIKELGSYISGRLRQLQTEESLTILEVGAGNGRLSHFLEDEIKKQGTKEKAKIIATDSDSWEIKPAFPVENIEVKEALNKYNPDIVICSWMSSYPMQDWTPDFQNTQSVKEYILIGDKERKYSDAPLFTRSELPEVTKTQICLHDSDPFGRNFNSDSKTISYRKDGPKITINKKL